MPTPAPSTTEEEDHTAAVVASRERLLSAVVDIHHAAHVIALNDDDAQRRHQEIADLADRALVEEGVLVPTLDLEPADWSGVQRSLQHAPPAARSRTTPTKEA